METTVEALQTVQFSYMLSGPMLSVQLPDTLGSLPELSTSIANGHGGRAFDFLPTGRSNGIPERYELIDEITDNDGRLVEVYRWHLDPPQWYLRWLLANGSLWTHLRPEDGVELAPMTIASLEIVEDPGGGTPFLATKLPLRSAVLGRPGYQEIATYFPRADSVESVWVTLRRPGYLSAGAKKASPGESENPAVVLSGTALGIDVEVGAEQQSTAGYFLDAATESLTAL